MFMVCFYHTRVGSPSWLAPPGGEQRSGACACVAIETGERGSEMTAKAPNILIVMADQMAPASLPIYGHSLVRAPNMQALARDGIVFDSAYCASPLCAP